MLSARSSCLVLEVPRPRLLQRCLEDTTGARVVHILDRRQRLQEQASLQATDQTPAFRTTTPMRVSPVRRRAATLATALMPMVRKQAAWPAVVSTPGHRPQHQRMARRAQEAPTWVNRVQITSLPRQWTMAAPQWHPALAATSSPAQRQAVWPGLVVERRLSYLGLDRRWARPPRMWDQTVIPQPLVSTTVVS